MENGSVIRRANGQFETGHPCLAGAGRHKGTGRSQRLIAAFKDCFTEEDVERLAGNLKDMALNGDIRAIRLILDILLPKSMILQSARQDASQDAVTMSCQFGNYNPYQYTTADDWYQDENGQWALKQ